MQGRRSYSAAPCEGSEVAAREARPNASQVRNTVEYPEALMELLLLNGLCYYYCVCRRLGS